MYRQIEYCPHCNTYKKLDRSLGLITFNGPDGIEEILVYQYHCSSCNSYVRSTTMNHEEYIRPGTQYSFNSPNILSR